MACRRRPRLVGVDDDAVAVANRVADLRPKMSARPAVGVGKRRQVAPGGHRLERVAPRAHRIGARARQQGLRADDVHDVDHPRRRARAGDLLNDADELHRATPRAAQRLGKTHAQQPRARQLVDRCPREASVGVHAVGVGGDRLQRKTLAGDPHMVRSSWTVRGDSSSFSDSSTLISRPDDLREARER
jgi:hypothetical protein